MMSEPMIYGLKIHVNGGCYRLFFKHTGDFVLADYDELDLEVISTNLTRKRN